MILDKCSGTEMKHRVDENAETVRARLEAYHTQTAPLIAYYDARGALERAPATGAITEAANTLNDIVCARL